MTEPEPEPEVIHFNVDRMRIIGEDGEHIIFSDGEQIVRLTDDQVADIARRLDAMHNN